MVFAGGAAQRCEVDGAGGGIANDAVLQAVGGVAGIQDGVAQEFGFGRGQPAAVAVLAGRVQGAGDADELEIAFNLVPRGVGGKDTVVVRGELVDGHHGFAAAGGATEEVESRGFAAVDAGDEGDGGVVGFFDLL